MTVVTGLPKAETVMVVGLAKSPSMMLMLTTVVVTAGLTLVVKVGMTVLVTVAFGFLR